MDEDMTIVEKYQKKSRANTRQRRFHIMVRSRLGVRKRKAIAIGLIDYDTNDNCRVILLLISLLTSFIHLLPYPLSSPTSSLASQRLLLVAAVCGFTNHVTIMCGAESRTVIVAIIVKRVKIIRHILSITIAANFQSLLTFVSSSSAFNLSVIICNGMRGCFGHHWYTENA